MLEVAVAGSALPGLRFTLEVELLFRSLGLGIEGGAIRSVRHAHLWRSFGGGPA